MGFVVVPLFLLAVAASCGYGEPTGPGPSPFLRGLAWRHAAGCNVGAAGEITIAVSVTDLDTPGADLSFRGDVDDCGSIDFTMIVSEGSESAASATITCPEVTFYRSSVTVTDPEGNSDSQGFLLVACRDGHWP